MNDELRELRENLSRLSDEELEQMVTVDADDYVPAALDLARRELEARGVTIGQKAKVADTDGDEDAAEFSSRDADTNPPLLPCPTCNGPVRPATLVGKDEIIAEFRDNNERRFVDIFVCTQCGEARLVVDLETVVREE
jgi:hypothetical protein